MPARNDSSHGRVRSAIRRLAAEYPFHVAILERIALDSSDPIATMGVRTTGNRIQLAYNLDFVLDLSLDELGSVLLHEVHHVLFGHVLADPADFPDEWARVVAEEVTVNEFIPGSLPAGAILLDQFPDLPPLESTAERYERLREQDERVDLLPPGEQPDDTDGDDAADGPDSRSSPLTDRSGWGTFREDPEQSRSLIEHLAQDAAIESRGRIPEDLRDALRGRLAGDLSHRALAHLGIAAPARIPWQRLLGQYLGRALATRSVFNHPSRRFPDLVGVVPGRRRRGARPRTMAVIDTSASLTDDLLAEISAELARLGRDFDVLVVECDREVQEVYRYRPIRTVRGRGGTDLRPPLEPAFLRRHLVDLVVYFTDGLGPAPDSPPPVPVVWCLVEGGRRPANWGVVIPMDGHIGP